MLLNITIFRITIKDYFFYVITFVIYSFETVIKVYTNCLEMVPV